MSSEYMPLVSIVILNWNEGERIQRCLEHVFNQSYPHLQVIIVDNGSTDGSTEVLISKWGNKVTITHNSENLGFPKGMNQGIANSHGKYVLLLNADLYLSPTFIEQAVNAMEHFKESKIGILSPILFKHQDGKNTNEIDSVGLFLLPYHTMTGSQNKTKSEYVFGPAGAAMFLSRKLLEDVQLPNGDYLDSAYFLYGEDIELYLRAQLMGWKCLFQPIIAGWNIGSASVGAKKMINKPDFFQVHAIKNRFFTILTCYPLCLWVRTLPWNILADMGIVGFSITTGRWRLLRNWFRAVVITIQTLSRLLRKRRWLQSQRRVSCKYLRSLYVKQSSWDTLRSLIHRA